MRLATAFDEIAPLKDPRVLSNPGYLLVILLVRVITRLGTLEHINPKVIEGLFAADLAYLQDSTPASTARATAACGLNARIASSSSRWSSTAWGKLALPRRAAVRGGSVRCVSLSLAARGKFWRWSIPNASVGRRDRQNQSAFQRL